ncbi:putative ring finger protein [Corchorus olitorius]|uniref:Ring finger protein n=1 Tax=Corchorus olitorius TaxID=93759 RepID=A0A1R3H4M5_9ROSI|nr:putative ring finger protein [Corchorus olitorius]
MGSEEDHDDGINFGVSRKIMFAAISSLLGVVVVIILLHLYARYLLKRQERRRRAVAAIHSQRAQIAPIDGSSIIELPPTKSSGLDPSVIASLPTFTYKVTTANHQEDNKELGARVLQPTAPPIEEHVSHGSGSRFGSFRRMMMLGRDRSSSRIRSCGDEIATQDLERQ